jgi:hypothetical protein
MVFFPLHLQLSGALAATPATEYCTVSAKAWSIQSTAAVISGAPTAQEHSTDLSSVATAAASVREQDNVAGVYATTVGSASGGAKQTAN